MKKIFTVCILFVSVLIVQAQGLVLSNVELGIGQYSDGYYLTFDGVLFEGTRGQVLDLEDVNLAQPWEKNLMILLEDYPVPPGATICFPMKKSSVFVQKNGYWFLLKSGLQGNVNAWFTPNQPFKVVIVESPGLHDDFKERVTYIKL